MGFQKSTKNGSGAGSDFQASKTADKLMMQVLEFHNFS